MAGPAGHDPATAVSIIPWWGLVATGAAVMAMVLYARVLMGQPTAEAARRLEASVSSLGRALLPLMLPVLLLALLVTAYYGPRSQVAVGVLVAAAVWFLLHGESELRLQFAQIPQEVTEFRMADPAERRVSKRTVGSSATVVGALVAYLLAEAVSEGWSEWTRAGNESGALVWLSVQLLVIGAALRLVGYATSWVRWLVAGVVALIAVRLGMLVGLEVLPSESRLDARLLEPGPALALLVAVLVALLGLEAIILDGNPAPTPTLARKLVRLGGLLSAMLATAAIVVGTIWAASETTDGAEPVEGVEPVEGGATREDRLELVDVSGGRERRLAWTFAPILRLHDDEPYPPTSARDYVRRARGNDPRQLRCGDCAEPENSTKKELHPEGVVFYARIATAETDREMFEAWTPGSEPLATLIQYWIFYDYNRWRAQTVLGQLIQEHDADWEFVAVGLDREDRPLFLALSAHCGGQVARWNDERAVLPGRVVDDRVEIDLPRGGALRGFADEPATHPIVAVALGSHGNYADDGGRRPPDWGSCRKLPTDALGPLVYASNVRDLTAAGTDRGRLVEADEIEVVTAESDPLVIPARWGRETLHFGDRDFDPTNGPRSPPRQATWRRALELFFCDRDWRAYARPPDSRC
jgi:hypothetical protein